MRGPKKCWTFLRHVLALSVKWIFAKVLVEHLRIVI